MNHLHFQQHGWVSELLYEMKQTKANNVKWNDCIDMIDMLIKSKWRNRKLWLAEVGVEGPEGLRGIWKYFISRL